jgi:hypothetical protein
MDFASPRLQAHPRLLQILNQPPTGTMHLQQGDTGGDVKAVQQALYDLCWTLRIQPPLTDASQFVIGTFGPLTAKTVLEFRTHHHIVFPGATAATSTVGTATLVKLDALIVQHDASVAAIQLHAQKLTSRGGATTVVFDTDASAQPLPRTVGDSGGVFWTATIDGVVAPFFHKASTGAYFVADPILDAYAAHGFPAGPLGFPIWDTYTDDDGGARNDFENGSLKQDPLTGEVSLLP